MCGIAGYIGPRPPSDEAVATCLARMRHRGPDGQGVYRHTPAAGHHVCLLHRRLSIIDLTPRIEPFRRSQSAITFNGEIYNYKELKTEMLRQGVSFATEGDTEVLIAGLDCHGTAWLDRAEGMWAFAHHDEISGRTILSRDRFGEKPLYLLEADGGLYFGSEIKIVVALAGRLPPVDLDHLLRYLVNGYKALYKTKDTFIEGVRELPPGEILTLEPARAPRRHRYWTPPAGAPAEMSFDDAVALIRARLIESVRLRLRADVPIAFCMSGGVDSNALIAIASRVFGYDVHGFTIANTDNRYEENDIVTAVVRELGIRHTMLPLRRDHFLDHLRRLVRHHDAPVYTLSYYVHWQLMAQVADQGYKICVSGTGADELFSGYFDHHNAYLAEMAADPPNHRIALANWRRHIADVVRNPFLKDPDLFIRDPQFREHIYLGAEGFAAALKTPWSEPFREECYAPGLLRNRMLNELFHESVPVILHEDDLNAMYYSIENRSPFLDRHLFEAALSIPTRHLMRDGYAKAVLRAAVAGIVPEPVLQSRRKVGFNAPLLDLLDAADPATIETLLAPSPIYDLVRRDAVEALIAKPALANSESKFLFNLLCAKFFLEAQAEGSEPAPIGFS